MRLTDIHGSDTSFCELAHHKTKRVEFVPIWFLSDSHMITFDVGDKTVTDQFLETLSFLRVNDAAASVGTKAPNVACRPGKRSVALPKEREG